MFYARLFQIDSRGGVAIRAQRTVPVLQFNDLQHGVFALLSIAGLVNK
jgi:hypothetical protein